VDTEGWLIRVLCMPADIQDWDGARDLFLIAKPVSPRLELVWADGAYGKDDLPEVVKQREGQAGFEVLPRRWVVERAFAWLCRNRRLSKDYEELPETTEAWAYAAMTRLMLRRLTTRAA
jgi:putative transposase